MKHFLIFGASRGLGAAFDTGLPEPGDVVWTVSRQRPFSLSTPSSVQRHWIQADLAHPAASQQIAQTLAGQPLDVLIYNAGIWEDDAFGPAYDFSAVSDADTQRILTVNLTAAITCIQKLLPNLQQSPNGKLILIGSTSGLENIGGPEVAYTASKFGLRGVAHALRENLRPFRIAVTCLNPGSLEGDGIPHADMVALVKCLINLSNATCVKEVDMPAMVDTFV